MKSSASFKPISKKNILPSESIWPAVAIALMRLTPYYLIRNPVMFVTYIGSVLTLFIYFYAFFHPINESHRFILQVSIWLWVTVIFANFSESLAERKGKAQAESLKKTRHEVQ